MCQTRSIVLLGAGGDSCTLLWANGLQIGGGRLIIGGLLRMRFGRLIAGFHCHAITKWIPNHSITYGKNFKCCKRLLNKQLLQVSAGLCSTLFLSYLPKRSTQIYRAQYADAILVSFRGTPTWRPEINENIWNSLLLWQRLVHFCKNHKKRPFYRVCDAGYTL